MEISKLQKTEEVSELEHSHIAYSGSPVLHPHDQNKLILVSDPCSDNTFYYEFNLSDVSYAEELQNIVNGQGETFLMARLWIKKGSVGVKCFPFVVEKTKVFSF